uniref:Uncharacterized protein n=1 Tax=Anopheles christyi TaxID=43041 RepID=A0A182JVV6_9DIPT
MSNLPHSNEERYYRNQLLCERLQQQQYNRQRRTPDERDSANDDASPPTPILQPRTTMARYPELVRRTQGRGHPRQDHPIYTLTHPDGECNETDGDIDDTLSEFAGGWYTPRLRHNRPSSMRASTVKKLNKWLDVYQQDRGKGRSIADLRLADYGSSEDEENLRHRIRESPEAEKPKEFTQESEQLYKESVETKPQVVPPPQMQEVTTPKTINGSSGGGYQLLSYFMTMLMYLAELISPITLQMLTFLQDRAKVALLYVWERFVQPILEHGPPTRNDAVTILVLLLVMPLIILLGIAYGAICILYWLNRFFLIEPNRL